MQNCLKKGLKFMHFFLQISGPSPFYFSGTCLLFAGCFLALLTGQLADAYTPVTYDTSGVVAGSTGNTIQGLFYNSQNGELLASDRTGRKIVSYIGSGPTDIPGATTTSYFKGIFVDGSGTKFMVDSGGIVRAIDFFWICFAKSLRPRLQSLFNHRRCGWEFVCHGDFS